MRQKSKSSPRAAASSSDALRWLLALGALGLMVWVFYESSRRSSARPGPAATNAVSWLTPPAPVRLPPVPLPPGLENGLASREEPPAGSLPSSSRTGGPDRAATNPPPPLSLTNRIPPGFALTNRPAASLVLTTRVASLADVPVPGGGRPATNVFEAQLALARLGLSPGSIDGELGSQTRAALRIFQGRESLPLSGELDPATRDRLRLYGPLFVERVITAADVAHLRPMPATWLGKSEQDRLDFQTILELVSEEGRAHPDLVRRLNPAVDWRRVRVGDVIRIPFVETVVNGRAALVRIRLAEKTLEARDVGGRVLVFFPCSIARQVEKRPVGRLTVTAIIRHPNYTFNPAVFPESAEAQALGRKLVLPPGPNNPVGLAWIGLSRPGYGIHGTPSPEQVGRTESHGCFRLANWNAETLAGLVTVGTPVEVQP